MLSIKDLKASIEDGTQILKGINLEVKAGEVHAIMGPNGSGKSTLSKVIAGHPAYHVDGGSVTLDGKDLLQMEINERANSGLFISTQYPTEIPGVNNVEFLKMALNSKRAFLGLPEIGEAEFKKLIDEKMELLEMDERYRDRGVNEGYSGGEKKRNEILQMAILDPKVSLLDETDSGLDIDALRIVAGGINHIMGPDKAVILVTHYQRLLDYIKPNFVHVLRHGKIILSGGPELALELEEKGYDWIEEK
ncbi:MAG: Fe-S cluster assembly ATPase SufC [Fibrobacter sp.]|uniref:Fe-S cluster assembly ATPase SufC n=1 Tax=Fibrobacter sp. TaxID=35828 RepID=UPI00388DF21E|nr:Fe-S cluster assembly ATPase SufC [Fibrobacter sp.]MBR2898345.1 Fe-S cluster assembly ATPase SufC [Fibrobacter sp.]